MKSKQRQQYAGEKQPPLVSIVLPVYNGKEYLREAIDSMLDQTFADFELIIINDGSSDESADIIAAFSDPRIHSVQQKNQGLAATLNRGISLASGRYIARQDQDDISLPDRLARQVAFLDSNPDYGMVGTWATIWVEANSTDRVLKHSSDNLKLKFDLLFDNPFVHSSMMIRKSVVDEVGGYATDLNRQPPEDYELWSRIARICKVANIQEVLHVYREVHQSMSRTGDNPFLKHLLVINKENLDVATCGEYPEQSYEDLAALLHAQYCCFSRRTPLQEMIAIIHKSAKNLSDEAGVNSSCILHEVQSRVNNLRYHYTQAKYLGMLGTTGRRVVNGIVRGMRNLVKGQRGAK